MDYAGLMRAALVALTRNKMRSLLTVLGITIGIAAVICVVAIGKAGQARVEQQLNNVRLMKGLESYPSGTRILLYGELLLKRGQRLSRVLDVVEAALIEYALAEDHILLNKQGTKTPTHTLSFRGNHASRQVAPLRMKVRAG